MFVVKQKQKQKTYSWIEKCMRLRKSTMKGEGINRRVDDGDESHPIISHLHERSSFSSSATHSLSLWSLSAAISKNFAVGVSLYKWGHDQDFGILHWETVKYFVCACVCQANISNNYGMIAGSISLSNGSVTYNGKLTLTEMEDLRKSISTEK